MTEEIEPAKKVLNTKPGGNGKRRGIPNFEVVRRVRRRTSHGFGVEIGELMRSQERNGGSSLRRSVPT